jgi:hypothetical protein
LLATPLAFLALAGSGAFSRAISERSGLKISARFTGGEVVSSVKHGAYSAAIHRPVFDGAAGERRPEGFIQVAWSPLAALPPVLKEEVPLPWGGSTVVTVNTVSGEASCSGGEGVRCQPDRARRGDALYLRIKLSQPRRGDSPGR